jgi:hypothetical protein
MFEGWNHSLTVAGHTVYSLSLFAREASDTGKDGAPTISEVEKEILDLVHFDKILNSDGIVILNVGGYVGKSTTREIHWARLQSRRIFWLESHTAPERLYRPDDAAAHYLLKVPLRAA